MLNAIRVNLMALLWRQGFVALAVFVVLLMILALLVLLQRQWLDLLEALLLILALLVLLRRQ